MLRHVRRLSGVAGKPLAEDLARRVAHELRASSAALASIDQLGVGHFGTVQLAKYALARTLIQAQQAGCSLYPPRPAARTPSGLSPADERLIRAIAALEEASASRASRAGAGANLASGAAAGNVAMPALTATSKVDRTFLMSFLADIFHNQDAPLDASQLLARWRYVQSEATSVRLRQELRHESRVLSFHFYWLTSLAPLPQPVQMLLQEREQQGSLCLDYCDD